MSLILRIAAVWTLGLAPVLTAYPVPTRPPAAGASAQLSDSQIEKDLRARVARSKLAPQKFQFKIQGGIATIDGKTDVIQHKGVMTRMAKSAGARAVVNRIEISEAARRKATARLEAGRVKAQVRREPVPPTR